MNITEQRKNAKEFVKRWIDKGSERSDAQSFWIDLFHTILDIDNPTVKFDFEKKVPLKTPKGDVTNDFIDAYVKDTHVVIEQKGSSKSLTKKYKQSDGSELTPYQQAKKYYDNIPYSQRGQFIVTSNFKEIRIYDLDKSLPEDHPQIVKLEDLAKEPAVLNFLTDVGQDRIFKEKKVSLAAGDLVAKIYDELLKQYPHPDSEDTQKSINQLCVRIVFCLYAEDAGIFGKKNAFHDYLVDFKASEMRDALNRLFEVLNTKDEDRNDGDVYYSIQEHKKLGEFPYVNGGMFAGRIDIPNFTEELRSLILRDASDNFDWSQISPTIFGAVFESTLNADERRKNGMHYTSIENIHKVIDPLFLNDLKKELKDIEETPSYVRKKHLAEKFQDKLSKLTFFDPACGSGNFLTESYLQLRELENEAIKIQHPNPMLDVGQASDYIKVSIQQFYGIELNDFAVSVAKTAMWIAESQMWEKTKDIIYAEGDFLPLKTYVHIHEGNALRIDWNSIVKNTDCSFILGNPPFVGVDMKTPEQKEDLKQFFNKIGKLDYVSAWYAKAVQYMQGTSIMCAFVSTNSIVQGTQVPLLWKPLLSQGLNILFAYRSFIWNNEAKHKANVYCVVIGFTTADIKFNKFIVSEKGTLIDVYHISPYLTEGDDTIVELHSKPISSQAPIMISGNKPSDGGNLIFDQDEYDAIKDHDPIALKYVKRYMMGREFIHNIPRYCLWLTHATPSDMHQSPYLRKHIAGVKVFREASKSKSTQKLAQTPYLFTSQKEPGNHWIAVARVSSEKRKYVPIGFLNNSVIPGDKLYMIPNADLFTFGLLASSVHNAWMRITAGRLELRYSYSNVMVYNTFPWPTPTEKQKHEIEQTAQAIFDARKNYPDSSLADLYDPLTMPNDLLKAHKENDKAVLDAYGLQSTATESEIVAHLFKMYEELTKGEKNESR